jgi:xylose isomerase
VAALREVASDDPGGARARGDVHPRGHDAKTAIARIFDACSAILEHDPEIRAGCIGLYVKAMRTTAIDESMDHLAHSRAMFLHLLEVVRSVDEARVEALRQARQYEPLEMLILNALMGRR